jgi:hypothetical protein
LTAVRPARRTILIVFVFVAPASSAQAAEPVVIPLDGRLYAELGGYVSVPNGPMTKELNQTSGGASFQFGMGLKGIPATLGIGAHQTALASDGWATGESGLFDRKNIGFESRSP